MEAQTPAHTAALRRSGGPLGQNLLLRCAEPLLFMQDIPRGLGFGVGLRRLFFLRGDSH